MATTLPGPNRESVPETVSELGPDALRRRCDPSTLGFATTRELSGEPPLVGQERAVGALDFAARIDHPGYNLFALGPPGTGKRTLVRRTLERYARERPAPPDLCYVHDFDTAHRPRALQLPPGTGVEFQDAMTKLVEDVASTLPAAFEGEAYQARRQAIQDAMNERTEARFAELRERARTRKLTMMPTPTGMVFAPVIDGEVLSPDAFRELPDEVREDVQRDLEELQKDLQELLRQVPRWRRQLGREIRELDREVADDAVGQLIDELEGRYAELPAVGEHLDRVRRDIIEHADAFLEAHREGDELPVADGALARRYRINLLIDNRELEHAPVVVERHPTYSNLLGRIEHLVHQGTLVTDFTLIRPGALHRANGGWLILDARQLLQHPFAWEALKRALLGREIRIEPLERSLGVMTTLSLEPEPVPLDLKVVLIGERPLWYLLTSLDPDLPELFKVAADFDEVLERDAGGQRAYARFVAGLLRRDELRPFDAAAVARVVDHSARLAGDARKLSGRISALADLLREADHWAGEAGREVATASDVERAVDERRRRGDRLQTRIRERIERDLLRVDTAGARVGQVNGLAVVPLGDDSFGYPVRISARVRLGRGDLIDIEREVELGGPVHSKGVMILAGFLGERYARDRPLSLTASLVFEQSYAPVDGDSASLAELAALLSAIAEVPIRQSLAVTGSIDQHGDVQPIGGVNEKIEGFFELCRARGLDGEQGVIIPAANRQHLMLDPSVVDAVADGRFHVYPVASADEGLALLTGLPSGGSHPDAHPEGGLDARIEARLDAMTRTLRAYAAPPDAAAEDPPDA